LDLLRYVVESILIQDYSDWEIIISDNNSEEDIASYVESLNEKRIHYVRTETFIPVTENWNHALQYATGDYVLMLGDDDAIMPGYFSHMYKEIEGNSYPDFIYTEAYQYAYPGVIPGHKSGFIQVSYNELLINNSKKITKPYLLSSEQATSMVRNSMSFRLAFGFNMQHYLVSKNMIDRLKIVGAFYQSPYPDYYASNALFLKARKILIIPECMVIIGISPKSFGYYYFNEKESEGDMLLHNKKASVIGDVLDSKILPGSNMNNSWLYAMEILHRNYMPEFNYSVNYNRYRYLQIYTIFSKYGTPGIRKLFPKLGISEIIYWSLFVFILRIAKYIRPQKYSDEFINWVHELIYPYPKYDEKHTEVPCKNILELIKSDAGRKAIESIKMSKSIT